AQAVYGFFNNGGTRCHVIRIDSNTELAAALNTFAAIDEITMVAIPGITSQTEQQAVIEHCENLKDRFALLDGQQNPTSFDRDNIKGNTRDSNYAALYFPWIKVFDPAKQILEPSSDGSIILPPGGHLAGIYSRVDGERGVFKAPANEVIRGALDLEYNLTKAEQDGLNPPGINIIRSFKGNIKVWGARTLGGDDNGQYKYISTRRYFNFLRESIDDGTQFAVFEPNNLALWQRIKRTVGDFLLNQWRDGALFGETPEKAFFVKCDAETNPPEVRELGQVVALIGVAIVKPAEFVIFRIQQMAGE
ncbi:MAG: phage tail sheath family protein, partial [Symploca sp. SIO2E6]|nr:phage tail sheath family protein [Symploca sp. SIO2E6]